MALRQRCERCEQTQHFSFRVLCINLSSGRIVLLCLANHNSWMQLCRKSFAFWKFIWWCYVHFFSTKDPGQQPFSFNIGLGSVIKGDLIIKVLFSLYTNIWPVCYWLIHYLFSNNQRVCCLLGQMIPQRMKGLISSCLCCFTTKYSIFSLKISLDCCWCVKTQAQCSLLCVARLRP